MKSIQSHRTKKTVTMLTHAFDEMDEMDEAPFGKGLNVAGPPFAFQRDHRPSSIHHAGSPRLMLVPSYYRVACRVISPLKLHIKEVLHSE